MRKMLDMIVSDALILPIPQLLLKNHPDFECWLTVDALDALELPTDQPAVCDTADVSLGFHVLVSLLPCRVCNCWLLILQASRRIISFTTLCFPCKVVWCTEMVGAVDSTHFRCVVYNDCWFFDMSNCCLIAVARLSWSSLNRLYIIVMISTEHENRSFVLPTKHHCPLTDICDQFVCCQFLLLLEIWWYILSGSLYSACKVHAALQKFFSQVVTCIKPISI